MKRWLQKDISRRAFFVCGAVFVCAKLLLVSQQLLLLTPYSSAIDDTLFYNAAQHITEGAWLGAYGYLTLSKYMLFAVWVAFLHMVHVPYLLGGQLLYTLAAIVGTMACAPVCKKNRARLFCFVILLFNPAQSAAAVQLRVYRDNITPALTLFLVAGFLGCALRWKRPVRQSVGYLLAAGVGLAGCVLNREDGVWLLSFAVGAVVVLLLSLLASRASVRTILRRTAALALPFVMLGAGVLAMCAVNQAAYGRFILSDFAHGEFAEAYCAMTRVTAQEPVEKVPVTREVRLRLYALAPTLAQLQPYLESDKFYQAYGDSETHEYGGGGFYWALRRAAQEAGWYADANTARTHFTALAQEINALCDSGALPAGRRSNSTMARFQLSYLGPTLAEGFSDFARVCTFAECAPANTEISLEMTVSPELRASYEAFLGNGCNWQAQENSDKPYYTFWQNISYNLLDAIRWAYAVCLPLAVLAALWQLVCGGLRCFAAWRAQQPTGHGMVYAILLGLLLCALLRCMMIAYLFVTSFNEVTRVMYLSSAHVLMLLFAVLGCALWAKEREGDNHG